MTQIEILQAELTQVRARMELEMAAGLGVAAEDVHTAAELLNQIRRLLLLQGKNQNQDSDSVGSV